MDRFDTEGGAGAPRPRIAEEGWHHLASGRRPTNADDGRECFGVRGARQCMLRP